MTSHSQKGRPKSSQSWQRPSIQKTSTPPHELHVLEPSNLEKFVKSTEFPAMIQVCSGTYITYNRKTIKSKTVLRLNKKIEREVVQISFKSPDSSSKRIVNLPLKGQKKIGFAFEQSSCEFKGVSQICGLKRNQKQPKILYTIEGCTCSPAHVVMSDTLIVIGVQRNEVTSLCPHTLRTIKLPKRCNAKFTADPKHACIDLKDVKLLMHYQFPWEVVLHEHMYTATSSLRNVPMKIECQFTEECVEVQEVSTDGSMSERYLIPVIACVEVAKHSCSEISVQENVYEQIDEQVLEQPTEIDNQRRVSESSSDSCVPHSSCSSKSSLGSRVSHEATSGSELHVSGTLIQKQFFEYEHEELTLKNILHGTKVITGRTFLLGVNLKIPIHMLEIVEANHPHDIERRKAEIFSYWLENEPNASWDIIVSALWDMDEFGAAEKIARIHNIDVPKREDAMTDMRETEEGKITEKRRGFKELGQGIKVLREDLHIIEHVCMFQKQSTLDHNLKLNEMKMAINDMERDVKNFPHEIKALNLKKQKQEEKDRTAVAPQALSSVDRDVSVSFQDSQIYYNAFPTGKNYASKLWVSERDIVGIELKEVEARIQTLENGIKMCKDRTAQLTSCTVSGHKTENEHLLEECYCVRLLLQNLTYQYKLAKLRYKWKQLNQKMNEVSEQMASERKQQPKYTNSQQERKHSTTITNSPRKPVPMPRTALRSKSASRQHQQPRAQFHAYGAGSERKFLLDNVEVIVSKSPMNQESTQQRDQSKRWSPTPKPRVKSRPATSNVSVARPQLPRSQSQQKRENQEHFTRSVCATGQSGIERALDADWTPVPQRRLPQIGQQSPMAYNPSSATRTHLSGGMPQKLPFQNRPPHRW